MLKIYEVNCISKIRDFERLKLLDSNNFRSIIVNLGNDIENSDCTAKEVTSKGIFIEYSISFE